MARVTKLIIKQILTTMFIEKMLSDRDFQYKEDDHGEIFGSIHRELMDKINSPL